MGSCPLSEFVSEAIQNRIQQLKREQLAQELEEGYRCEAEHSSLDVEWAEVETEGL